MKKIEALQLDSNKNPRQTFEQHFQNSEWPFHGGWGYTREDAVVIECDNTSDGVAFEYKFAKHRSFEELITLPTADSRLYLVDSHVKSQSMMSHNDKRYDVLYVTVIALPESDYELLKKDWEDHNGYIDDLADLKAHDALRESKMVAYDTEIWFDITNFFGKF